MKEFFTLFLQKISILDILQYQQAFLAYLDSKNWVREPKNLYEPIDYILQLGGITSSFPAIKRNGTQIDIRLADDSGYADLAISSIDYTDNMKIIVLKIFFHFFLAGKNWEGKKICSRGKN